ncbi:hypothetical protein DOO74_05010 [Rhodobacteraceae bacterium AsT-22]|nr:hypothetical protein DOO74_05010 [Rhodobacteraceae bacterium AsT-22]
MHVFDTRPVAHFIAGKARDSGAIPGRSGIRKIASHIPMIDKIPPTGGTSATAGRARGERLIH